MSDEINIQFTRFSAFYYQKLGCWSPHVEITRPAFEVALDVFQYSGLITKRHRNEDIVVAPPEC